MRLVVVTCFYNEWDNIPGLVNTVSNQSQQPDLWYLIDDGSTDSSLSRFTEELSKARIPIMVHKMPEKPRGDVDKIGFAFRSASFFQHVQESYDLLMKIDADTRLPPDYIEFGRDVFATLSDVGVMAGQERGELQRMRAMGTGKFVRMNVVNGMVGEYWDLDPDSLWNLKARLMGYRVEVLNSLLVESTRPSHMLTPRGFFRQGERMSYVGWSPLMAVAVFIKSVFRRRPYALQILRGYLSARIKKRYWRCEDPDVRFWYSLKRVIRERSLKDDRAGMVHRRI